MRSALAHIAFFLLLAIPLSAQVDTTRTAADTSGATSQPPRGSAGVPDSTIGARQTPAPGVYVMTKDPLTATLLSIVPGAGQVYTEQYLKAGAFLGVATFFAVRAVYYHGRFLDWADQYDALPENSLSRAGFKANREFNRDERDLNAAYFIGVQILSMIDAYVGAHLFDFDVDDIPGRDADQTSSKIYLDPLEKRVGFRLRF